MDKTKEERAPNNKKKFIIVGIVVSIFFILLVLGLISNSNQSDPIPSDLSHQTPVLSVVNNDSNNQTSISDPLGVGISASTIVVIIIGLFIWQLLKRIF